MAVTIDRDLFSMGAGELHWAPLGTAEPTNTSSALGSFTSSWTSLGPTKDGSSFGASIDADAVEVAEQNERVDTVITGVEYTLEMALAHVTAEHLSLALNQDPADAVTSNGSVKTFTPPDSDDEPNHVMLAWTSRDGKRRALFRDAINVGGLELANKKGADYATVNAEFQVNKPDSATAAWVYHHDTS